MLDTTILQTRTNPQEIFRHLRPKSYNAVTREIAPLSNGGISFLLLPDGDATYNYWLNACPSWAPFSSRVAVQQLRAAVQRNVVPWGTIKSTGEPILDQIVTSLLAGGFSEVRQQVAAIALITGHALDRQRRANELTEQARKYYTET